MPKTVRTISCCYCDASTLVDLTKLGRGVLTCDACGARLSSARMQAVVNKPVPVRHDPTKRVCGGWGGRADTGRASAGRAATLDPRWQGGAGALAGIGAGAAIGKRVATQPKKKSKPKKRKSFLDRLEDLWDEIEDIGDDIKDIWD